MRYLTLAEVLDLHRRVIEQSGGGDGVRDLGAVAIARNRPNSMSRSDNSPRSACSTPPGVMDPLA